VYNQSMAMNTSLMTLGSTPVSGSSAQMAAKLPAAPAPTKKAVTPTVLPNSGPQPSANTSNNTNASSSAPDYYSQALSFLQPSINAQTQPYKQMLANLPGLYQTQQTGLQNEATDIQNVGNADIQSIQDQTKATGQQIRTGTTAALGSQRANNAANGFASTSGVEQSQEGNIQNQAAMQLYNLDQQTNDETTKITSMTQEQLQPILTQIAQLPQEQAQQALQIGAQIASIQGQGSGAALTYAGNMAQLALQEQQFGLQQKSTTADVAAKNAQTQALTGGKTTVTQQPRTGILGGLLNTLLGTPTTTSTTGVSDPLGLGL
jgi:hypothetical protein